MSAAPMEPCHHRDAALKHAGNPDALACHRLMWGATPFVTLANIGALPGKAGARRPRLAPMVEWCRRELGPEAAPWAGDAGRWLRGFVIQRGFLWFGFQDAASRRAFEAEFGGHTTRNIAVAPCTG